ncbi:MAG: hypothetical protein JNJ99_16230, partial [Crocinitomicaceae bacterium]|nr:hypothetical protein [Crocinitomicaceae bacterium]
METERIGERISIPFDWYRQKSAHFITYFGEIYYGGIWELPQYPDRFFIVQNDKMREINDLKPEDKTLENYRRLGREIKDPSVIKAVVPDDIGQDISFKEISYGMQKFKRMFIFGAGASKYCVFNDTNHDFQKFEYNPPNGLELF